jgi:hypothetical protein
VFIDPAPGMPGHYRFVVVVDSSWRDLTLNVDGLCPGASGAGCLLGLGPCAGSGRQAMVWTWGPLGPGPHTMQVWKDDPGAPCRNDGGHETIPIALSFTLP